MARARSYSEDTKQALASALKEKKKKKNIKKKTKRQLTKNTINHSLG
jgi:hypothetical protein